jgi:hypothetical protein
MTNSTDAAIVPITLTVNGRIGLTLWAPPWEDEDGEEWQGFLGDGAKILLYPGVRELADFIASGVDNDLSDHPAWGYVQKLTPDQLRPAGEDAYDLDAVYEWASGEPDPVHVSALANVVDMVAKIADCCDDGALRALVANTPAYEELVADDVSYQGKDGQKRWNELGDMIADTWERAIGRVDAWLAWEGDFTTTELESELVWDRVDAEPLELVFADVTYYTVRAYVSDDTEDDAEAAFIGGHDTITVFTSVADLATYCRLAHDHTLRKLEWWSELAEIEDDEVFRPTADSRYDLRKPTASAADLVRELADFCGLEADTSVLDTTTIDRDDWRALVDEVRSCLQPGD